MRIAILGTRGIPAGYGGFETFAEHLSTRLVARGHEVTLFSSDDCVTRGRLHPVCDTNLTGLIEQGRAYCFEYYASSAMAEVLGAARDFDVIHYHLASAWLPLASCAPRMVTIATPRRWNATSTDGCAVPTAGGACSLASCRVI